MNALLITGDAQFAAAMAADLERLPEPIALETTTTLQDAMARLGKPGLDAVVVDLAHPLVGTGLSVAEAARKAAPDISLVAIVSVASQGAQVVTTGAHAFVRLGPSVSQTLAAALRAVNSRRRFSSKTPLRVLYVSRDEPFRDQSLGAPLAVEPIVPKAGMVTLPVPHDSGVLNCDAVVVDLSSGAIDLLELLQDAVRRSGDRPVLVLADGGDRAVATAAFRLGALQVIAKNGAWPLRLSAAIEQTVGASRLAAETEHLRQSDDRHRRMIDTLPVGVMVLNAEGIVVSVNAAGLALTGGAPLVGTALADHIVTDERSRIQAFLAAVAAGTAETLHATWRGGSVLRPIELNGTRLSARDKGAVALVSINVNLHHEGVVPATVASGSTVSVEEHAALRARFEASAQEADKLRNQLADVEAEQVAFSGRMAQEVSTLQELFSQVAQEAESRGGVGVETATREISRLDAALAEAEVALAMASEAHAREVQQLRTLLAGAHGSATMPAETEAQVLKEQLVEALETLRITETASRADIERHRLQRDEALMALQEAEAEHERTLKAQEHELDQTREALRRLEESRRAGERRLTETAERVQMSPALSQDRDERVSQLGRTLEQERVTTARLQAELEQARKAVETAEHALAAEARGLAALSEEVTRARADHESSLRIRAQEVVTLCSALDAAEQARAAIDSEHAVEVEALRAAFVERETGYVARIASLEQDTVALRQGVTDAGRPTRETLDQTAQLQDTLAQARATVVEQARRVDALERTLRDQERLAAGSQQEHAQVEGQLRRAIEDRDASIARANANQAALQRRIEQVSASERRWFDNDLVAVAVTTADGQLIRANGAFSRLFGEAARDVLKRIPESWSRALTPAVTIDHQLPPSEGSMTLADGRNVRYVETAALVAESGGEAPVIERWFLETTARQSEAQQPEHRGAETIGRVAGEFVREIEQHVNAVQQLARRVLERTDPYDPRAQELRAVVEKAVRAEGVTTQFLAFSRGRLRVPDWLPISEMLHTLQPLLQHLTGEGIALSVGTAPERLCVNAPREPLVRTLLSLVTAASDSLPLGGQIFVGVQPASASVRTTTTSTVEVRIGGFGQQPLRDPGSLDPALENTGASLRVVNEPDTRAFELTLRTLERPPVDAGGPGRG